MDFDTEFSVVLCVDVLEFISLDVSVIEGDSVQNLVEIFLGDRLVKDNLLDFLLVV